MRPISLPSRPQGLQITEYATEYVVDLGVPDGQPGHDSEVRVVLPSKASGDPLATLVVNGSGAFRFSGMVLSDQDIEPMLPYVKRGFAVVAYETDGCQPDLNRDPTADDILQMTRRYVASKAGLINAKRAIDFALMRFHEIDPNQLFAIGHSSGGKQALLLAAHDHRIKACVAFSPACKMDYPTSLALSRLHAEDTDYLLNEVKRSMPIAHAKATKVPVLLFCSQTDRITRPSEVRAYAKVVGSNAQVHLLQGKRHVEVPSAAFGNSVTWLRRRGAKGSRMASQGSTPIGMPRQLNAPGQVSRSVKKNPFAGE